MTGSFPYRSRAFHSASWVRGFPGECCAAVLRMVISRYLSGSSSAVERQLPKLDVAGSIPVSRSILPDPRTLPASFLTGLVEPLFAANGNDDAARDDHAPTQHNRHGWPLTESCAEIKVPLAKAFFSSASSCGGEHTKGRLPSHKYG